MSSKSQRPSSHNDQDLLVLGTPIGVRRDSEARNPVCIPSEMRGRHVHLIGLPGTGKSMLMETMILDDIRQGAGVAVIDPHGELVEGLLHLVPDQVTKPNALGVLHEIDTDLLDIKAPTEQSG